MFKTRKEQSFLTHLRWVNKGKIKFREVKLIVLAITVFVGVVQATNQDTMLLTLNVTNGTLQSVLETIEQQTEYNFFFNNNQINTRKLVTIKKTQTDLFSILNELFEGTDISYKVLDNSIILSNVEQIARAQQTQKRITGIVKDDIGEPIIGANVVVRGTTIGTITGLDGDFQLEVPEQSVLVVSYIGYLVQEIPVSSSNTYNIILKEDAQTLDEVIVTALGIRREEKALGYSVQKISGEELTAVKGTDVTSSLTGKIAGLFINNSAEISEKPTIQLRGEEPLIVIDGVAYQNMTLSDLSADDIESLDVLKGATASALYGVRGRAGAIMITTKRSGAGSKLVVNVSNNTMVSAGYLRMPQVQSSFSTGNYGQLEYNSGNVWGDYMDGHEVVQYDPYAMELRSSPLLSRGKNNLSNFLQNSLVTNSNVNISQSGELGGFRASATQVHQKGSYPNTKIDKFMLNANGNITYNKFKLDVGMSYKKEMAPNMPYSVYGNGNVLYNMLIWGGTEYDIRDFKNYWRIPDQKQNWPFEAWYDNPYYLMHERTSKQDNDLFNTNITMSYEIKKNLSVMFRSGYDNFTNTQEKRQSVGDSGERRGRYDYNQFTGSSFNNDLIINGDFKWKDFGIDVIGGLSSYWYKKVDLKTNTRGGLSVPGFYSLNASIERPNVTKEEKEKAVYSAYGKVGLSWRSGIYVDVTGRNDWSSTLPSSSRSYFYPSVSASFIPTAFYNPFEDILDFWKIRASWTIAKSDLTVYELNRVYEIELDKWDGLSTATYPKKLRDPNVKPEKERSYEIGTDFRFFNNRLGFDYTYFNRLRSDRLITAYVPDTSGFEQVVTNTQEELMQKGMEFTLRGRPIVNKHFEWEAVFNGAFWHWYYHSLDPVYSSQDPRIGVGERRDKFFMTDWERDHAGNIVHQAGLPVKNKYESVIGHRDPKFILGFTNKFSYKDFDLSISLDGRIGGLMYSWTEQAMWHSGAHQDSDNQWRYAEVVEGKQNYVGNGVKVVGGSASYDPYGKVLEDNRVFAPNDVAVSYQGYTMIYNENPWDHQAYQNIKDASFIKLREVALNYTLPRAVAERLLMKSVRVGIIGQNLLMWTKEFKFSDPDRYHNKKDNGNQVENLNSPTSRYIGFNVNLTL